MDNLEISKDIDINGKIEVDEANLEIYIVNEGKENEDYCVRLNIYLSIYTIVNGVKLNKITSSRSEIIPKNKVELFKKNKILILKQDD